MYRPAETMADAPHPALFGTNVKPSAGAYEHSAHIAASFGASGNRGAHEIPGLEALDLLGSFRLGTRKADVVDVAFLSAPMPGCRSLQGNHAIHLKHGRGAAAHTGRVNPVLLRQAPLGAVVLRHPS